MKRIKAACICQTLHFMLKEDVEHSEAVALVKHEVEHYREGLERNRIRYRILEQQEQADGSVIIKVIKQYNSAPMGEYWKDI